MHIGANKKLQRKNIKKTVAKNNETYIDNFFIAFDGLS